MRAERIEHSAHRVAYWPMTDQTLRKCRVVVSCRIRCESALRVLACTKLQRESLGSIVHQFTCSLWRIIFENFNPNGLILAEI